MSHLVVHSNGVECKLCGELYSFLAFQAGDWTPLSTFIVQLRRFEKQHPPEIHEKVSA